MDLFTFQALRVFPTWASGLTSWEADWAQALVQVGGPRTIWFFGLSADPSIPHDDPRAKEALPWRGDAPPSTWSIDSAEQIAVRAPTAGQPAPTRDGALSVWPGLTASGFNLGACDNVSMTVCRRVAAGGGDTFDAADVAVLDVLLLRALALRDPTTASSWTFHLPAIELYDYTNGCEVDGWRWTGDRCQAALIQEWAVDAELRHVRAGRMDWTVPSDLP